ncbi:hypothetical protein C457_19423 [Haloferax prahovense DSM 18310]|uniref:Acetyl xylan esterase domain-containing protein n=1 Tax=Haloferax prahovense (strain DSM 18310 / JCM 13924 / TL6) TaxID=1227461 RepID=M0FXY0_HALPT|nr:alpha/beta fold hydrolase [Haloferax prahovense]ELZ63444.1 hypothetical protein C457_19423 [Haloferax prahovense DSM 18310]
MTGFDYDDWFDDVLRATDGSAAYAGETGQEFEAWQESFRAELRDVLGFPAIRDSAVEDIDPRRREHPEATVRHRSYERRTWSVRTERGFRVPFYLLLPDSVDPPYPVAVALHGHTEHGKDLAAGVAEGEAAGRHIADDRRDMARQAARRGFAVVAPDMRAFGELSPDTSDDSDSSDAVSACTRWQKRAQLLGRSLVGERVWDVRRLVDFVEGHSALDADRLAVCGHSGGGTVALLAGALDDRIGHVVACASVCPFEDSIVPIDHCLCNYVPGLRRLGEVWDIAGLVAPRSLRIVAGESDPIFPIAGTRRAFDRIQGRYRAADAEGECSLFVGDGGHRFFEAGAWPFLRDRL